MLKISEHTLVDNGYRRTVQKNFLTKSEKEIHIMTYETVPNPDAVVVLGRTNEGEFLLIEEYRFGPEKILLSAVSGGNNPGESPIDAALREFKEETGYSGGGAIFLGNFVHNYYISGTLSYFFVHGLESISEQSLDANEEIEVKKFTQKELEKMIEEGKLECPYTVSLYYLAKEKTKNFTQFDY